MAQSNKILKAREDREKDIRRQHILDSAEVVMQRVGLNKLSISAVAKEAKLAAGTLYLYFKNKEELIAQLVLKARQLLLDFFHKSVYQIDDPLEQVRQIMLANLKFYHEHRLYYDLLSLYEVETQFEETPELAQASTNIHALVVSILDRAKSRGLIRSEISPSALSFISWGSCMGMVQLIDVKKEDVSGMLHISPDQLYQHFVDFMIDGLRAPQA